MLISQKEASIDEPTIEDLFTTGTIASILQMLKLPDGTVKILVEGLQRAKINTLNNNGHHFIADIELINAPNINNKKNKVLLRTTINQFEKYIKLNKKIPPEILNSLNNIDNTDKLGDTIAAHIPLKNI